VAFDSGGSEDALRRKGHIPNLARHCLRDLQEAGLHTVWRSEDSGDLRLVHLESGQAFCVEFGRYRGPWGVPSVEVAYSHPEYRQELLDILDKVDAGQAAWRGQLRARNTRRRLR
jgi:hypothetical protein